MTRQRSIELNCPQCGKPQSVTLYDTINVSLDPSLKEKLFKGEVNIFQCENCEERLFVPMPLLYHDMGKHLLVQFYPFNFLFLFMVWVIPIERSMGQLVEEASIEKILQNKELFHGKEVLVPGLSIQR